MKWEWLFEANQDYEVSWGWHTITASASALTYDELVQAYETLTGTSYQRAPRYWKKG